MGLTSKFQSLLLFRFHSDYQSSQIILLKPTYEELLIINKSLNETLEVLKKRLKKLKIDAEIFVGGSFAKNTVIKKDHYDVDIFIRYSNKHSEDIKVLTKKLFIALNSDHTSLEKYLRKRSRNLCN